MAEKQYIGGMGAEHQLNHQESPAEDVLSLEAEEVQTAQMMVLFYTNTAPNHY